VDTVVFFASLVSRVCSPRPPGKVILPGANGQFDPEEGPVSPASQGEGCEVRVPHNGTW
jgi:hypothetical protein